ncbi:hypothetical protein LCGC14_1732060 [marine sediment metagenome]|uniref:PABS domain-containing protein n=1 Tax=marine sediment metagenome TaxID=412755 RepID=A0A0F9H982_9ZZZZ
MKQLRYSNIMDINVDIPEGENGDWKITRFKVSEKDAKFHNLRCSISMGGASRGRDIDAGDYTQLTRRGKLIMSDTPAEKEDHMEFICKAKGNVLINGLGMGWTIEVLLRLPQVTSITVIEISQDLIDLVGPHYHKKDKTGKLNIVCADAFEWKPPKGTRYNAVWHDIWDDICGDNLDSMKKLHRKYGRRTDWQGSWCRWTCER